MYCTVYMFQIDQQQMRNADLIVYRTHIYYFSNNIFSVTSFSGTGNVQCNPSCTLLVPLIRLSSHGVLKFGTIASSVMTNNNNERLVSCSFKKTWRKRYIFQFLQDIWMVGKHPIFQRDFEDKIKWKDQLFTNWINLSVNIICVSGRDRGGEGSG